MCVCENVVAIGEIDIPWDYAHIVSSNLLPSCLSPPLPPYLPPPPSLPCRRKGRSDKHYPSDDGYTSDPGLIREEEDDETDGDRDTDPGYVSPYC